MHIWALGLSCETPAAPPDRAAGARTRQPENSKTCTFQGPALQTPPKFHVRTPRERKKKENCGGKTEKKARNFGLSHPLGLHPSGLHPSGSTLRGSTLRGPTFRGTTFSGFGPPPSGPPPFAGPTLSGPKIQHPKIGRSRNWPKSKLAEVWPKSKLAEVDRARSIHFLVPLSVAGYTVSKVLCFQSCKRSVPVARVRLPMSTLFR